MDEKSAWRAFCSTGSVRDYLSYARGRRRAEKQPEPEEGRDENGYAGPGGLGSAWGRATA